MTLSLRARLLLGVVALVLVGIVISDIATYAALKDFSYKRVDDQLLSGRSEAIGQVLPQGGDFGHGPDRGAPPTSLPIGTYLAFVTPAGQIVTDKVAVSSGSQVVPKAKPILPHP